jgi:thiazole synthase
MTDELIIAGKSYRSRLMVGTGRYASPEECIAALDASGAELVTVVRRLDLDNPSADQAGLHRLAALHNPANTMAQAAEGASCEAVELLA